MDSTASQPCDEQMEILFEIFMPKLMNVYTTDFSSRSTGYYCKSQPEQQDILIAAPPSRFNRRRTRNALTMGQTQGSWKAHNIG